MEIKYLDSKGQEITHFTQWDINRLIKITGINKHTDIMIHFYNSLSSRALVVKPQINIEKDELIVKVPNLLLQQEVNLNVAIYVKDEVEGLTYFTFVIPVQKRKKPEDYTFEENIDYINWVELDKLARDKYNEMQIVIDEATAIIGDLSSAKEYIDTQDVKILNESKKYILDELKRPQHNTMIVTAMQEGIAFKSDYTANEIKRHADGGGVVILRFNAPDGSGEQSYNYETFKNNLAIFRRTILYKQTNLIKRIIISIDNNYNVTKEEEEIQVATSGDLANANDEINYLTEESSRHEQDIGLIKTEQTLQNSAIEKNSTNLNDLDHDKLGIIRYPIASDKLAQLEATDIISNYGNYEGKIIEFLTNGEAPNKTVGYGFLMTDKQGNQFLIVYDLNGTITQYNKSYFEKHNFETYSYINEMVDLDNFTIDVQGNAPYMASVQKAFNKPSKTSDYGIITVIAYNISNQVQIYRDITTNKMYYRLVTGTADRHSFSQWNEQNLESKIADLERRIALLEAK